jgi:hypothetical protein
MSSIQHIIRQIKRYYLARHSGIFLAGIQKLAIPPGSESSLPPDQISVDFESGMTMDPIVIFKIEHGEPGGTLITTKAQLADKQCWCNMLISNAFMSFGVSFRSLTSNVCEKSLLMHNKISPFGRNDRELQNMSKIYAEL